METLSGQVNDRLVLDFNISCQVLYAAVLINATGLLHTPLIPQFEGSEQFEGKMVHTARWPNGLRLEGQRVVVIGSGASAIQVDSISNGR